MSDSFSALHIVHKAVKEHVKPGDFCIDATAGRGRDSALLCSLVGCCGRVLAFDIQKDAIESTTSLINEKGYSSICRIICDSHSNIYKYAKESSVDCIMFNFGWLPAGDHNIFTRATTSIPAIAQSLKLIKPGGLISLCIYYGRETGFDERDALLEYLKTIDSHEFTVILCSFYNRTNNPPIPVLIMKT